MTGRIVWCLTLSICAAGTVFGQDKRVEVSPWVGYTFSEGIAVDPRTVVGITVDEINPTSGLSYGAVFNVFVNENMQVGFLWGQQESNLEIKGTGASGKENVADMKVRNYHGIFTYNWGDEDTMARPYLFGGLGATQYSPGDVMGQPVEGNTRFSTTWGGGIKIYPRPHFGFNVMARWTPTYIKSDPAGIWCSPYWPGGCWQLTDPDYSNQLEFGAGVAFRF